MASIRLSLSPRLPLVTAGAAVLLALCPAAPAAPVTAPVTARSACDRALAAAEQAEHDHQALKKELEGVIADGGHPDASQRQALENAEAESASTASQAQRVCGP
jgi:septal ring factor EnvC (AmiA/AmiB activator)